MRLVVRALLALTLISYVATAYAAVTVSVNGSNHTIPQTGEKGWGTNVTAWIQAISANTLQPSGGTFTLTADTNFGGTYGLVSPYYKSRATNISTVGAIRIGTTESIGWRNNANAGNVLLGIDSSDRLLFNGAVLPTLASSDFVDSGFTISDNSDASKKIAFQATGIGTSTTRTLTVPDASGTLVLEGLSQTLTNKTLTAPEIATIANAGATLTLPTVTTTLVGIGTTNTLTNKTLHMPDGSSSLPGFTYEGDTDTGIYRVGANNMAIVAGTYKAIDIVKSTGDYANVAFGGGAASTSDIYSFAVKRDNSTGTAFAVENVQAGSGAFSRIQLINDTGAANTGDVSIHPAAQTLAAYTSRMAMHANGSTAGLSFLANGAAPKDIRFYHSGGAAANESLRLNSDYSLQVMQSISDPSAPSSGVLLYGNGTDLRLRGTSGGARTIHATAITAKGDLAVGSTANTLVVKTVGSDGTFLKADSTASGGVAWASPASVGIGVTAPATTATVSTSEDVVLATTASAWSLTLYACNSGNNGKRLYIKKTSSDVNALTIDGNASETIEGTTTYALYTLGESLTILCDGTNTKWHILDHTIPSEWVAYTPTITSFGTVSGVEFESRRVGDSLEIQGRFTTGTPTAVESRITLGFNGTNANVTSASTTKIPSLKISGEASNGEVSANLFTLVTLMEPSVGYITMGFQGPSNSTGAKALGNAFVSASKPIYIRATVPITGWRN